jgi:ABC-2 type transport system ATP-binding protein
VTIFLTTQYLEEADNLADRIAILDRGKIVAQGTPEELKRVMPGGHMSLRFVDPQGLEAATGILAGSARDDDPLVLRVPGDGSVRVLRSVFERLDRASVEVESVSVHTPDLDDVFLALTGQSITAKETV